MKRDEINFDELSGDLYEADALMERYGKWSMDRYKKQRCASAERNYQAPPNDDDRKPKLELINDFDAMEIHRAVIKVPRPYRDVLFAHYVQTRVPVFVAKRKLGMSWSQFETARISGLRMMMNIRKANKI